MTDFLSREFVFAGLAIIVAALRYGTYLWSIYKKETRPNSFSWFFTLFAVPSITFANLLYPGWLMLTDWGFMLYIVWRRRIIKHA